MTITDQNSGVTHHMLCFKDWSSEIWETSFYHVKSFTTHSLSCAENIQELIEGKDDNLTRSWKVNRVINLLPLGKKKKKNTGWFSL